MSFRLITSLLCALAGALALAPGAGAATRSIAPSGSDSGSCTAHPCKSFSYAHQQASSGDTVVVHAGVYSKQTTPASSKQVTFRGLAGNKVRAIDNEASNITFDGIDIDANMSSQDAGFYSGDGSHVTFKNGRIGNVVDEKGAMLGGWSSAASQHVVFDHVLFHDVLQVGDGVHNECLYSQSPGLTVRNSTFRNCATMDLMVTRGSWWGQPVYGGLTLENNVFGHSVNGRPPYWHYYGFLLHGNMGRLTGARIVNNTFETDVGGVTREEVGAASGVWANNIGGGWDCLPGMTYRGNVGKKCSGSDHSASPDTSCAPPTCPAVRIAPMGWVNPMGGNFHLKAGSRAINAGSAAYAPARDLDGKRRDGRPDAGAYEYGAGGSAGSPGAPSPAWRLQRARLSKRTICHKPRKGCPRSTKLRLALGRHATVAVRLDRLRKGKAAKRARVLRARKLGLHKAIRIKARGLKAGRYRLTVLAVDATKLRAKPVRLRLRVR